ncbi:TetR/AcrR family transcriptional regulator [Sphingobium cloacae]|nr:TetR/AcrR family transcriptional regulator [Sphingobium cloacae]
MFVNRKPYRYVRERILRMRVRTDDRRQAILDVATEMFREVGYARASMAAISARIGGSKGTLYRYFKSKEELFAGAMMAVMEEQAEDAIGLLDTSNPDVCSALRGFGLAYLALLTSSDAIAIMRAAIAEGANSALGSTLYTCGAERAWREMAAYIAHLHETGALRAGDAKLAAAHLKGLLEAGMIEPLLFGAKAWFAQDEAVDAAVDRFLRAYDYDGDAGDAR